MSKGLYWLFGLWLWLVFVWMQLPAGPLAASLSRMINEGMDPAYQAEIQSADTGLMGLTLKGVKLWDRRAGVLLVELNEVDLSLAPWYLLRGRLGFDTAAYGGEISGSFKFLLDYGVQLKVQNLQPNRILALRKTGLIRSNPEMDLLVNLNLSGNEAQGKIELEIHNLILEAKAEDLNLIFDLPSTNFLKLTAKMEIEPKSSYLHLTGKGDLKTDLEGRINYPGVDSLAASKLDMVLKLKPKDEYLESLGVIAQFAQGFTDPTGVIGIHLHGPMMAPSVEKL